MGNLNQRFGFGSQNKSAVNSRGCRHLTVKTIWAQQQAGERGSEVEALQLEAQLLGDLCARCSA